MAGAVFRHLLAGALTALVCVYPPGAPWAGASAKGETSPAPRARALEASPAFEIAGARQHPAGWLIADLDGDSWDELLTTHSAPDTPTTSLVLRDFTDGLPCTVRQLNLGDVHCIDPRYAGDLDADGAADVAVSFKRGSSAWVEVRGRSGDLLLRTPPVKGPDANGSGDWDGQVYPLTAADLDGDGDRELVASVVAGLDRSPRGLIAYDSPSGRELWRFPCGSTVAQAVALADPVTGEARLLVATLGFANGADEGGFDDLHGYLILLDGAGRILQRRDFGGACAKLGVALGNLGADGRKEAVLAARFSFQTGEGRPVLAILDPLSFEVRSLIDPGTPLDPPLIADLDCDGRPEILTAWERTIYVRDPSLGLVREIPCPAPVQHLRASDLDGDGCPELICAPAGTGAVRVLTPRGELLAEIPLGGEPIADLGILRWGPRRQLLLARTASRVIGWSFRDAAATAALPVGATAAPGGPRGASSSDATSLVLGLLAGVLLGAVGAWALSRLRLSSVRPGLQAAKAGGELGRSAGSAAPLPSSTAAGGEPRPDPNEADSAALRSALTELTAFGHGEPGAALARTATLLQGATDSLVRDPEWRAQVLESCAALRLLHAPLLRAMIAARPTLERYEAAGEPIIAGFRRILLDCDSLTGDLERGANPEAETAVRIGRAVQELDLRMAAARQRLREAFHCNVMNALGMLMFMKQPLFVEHDVLDHTLHTRSPWGALVARIDAQRFMFEVFDDLITNAVLAMRRAPVRRLTVSVERVGPVVAIRLSDTGCGIDPTLRTTLFSRGVSTRGAGSGLGLFMAQQTLREFGGRIRVESSAPGEGTTFVVEIPAAQRDGGGSPQASTSRAYPRSRPAIPETAQAAAPPAPAPDSAPSSHPQS